VIAEPATRPDGGGVVVQLVTSLHFGGTERQVAELVRGLAGSRWDTRVACFRKEGGFLPEVQALGIEPHHFPLKGSLARPNTVFRIAELAAYLVREEARVLHCHDIYAAIVGVPAARLAGVPVVSSRRDLGHHLTGAHRLALRGAMLLSTRVLANAATVAAQTERESGVNAGRLVVVPNGLDLERFDRRLAAELEAPVPWLGDPTVRTVAKVARMSYPAKGHADLLEAAAIVRKTAPELRFLLVGDGPREPELRRMAERLGVADIVAFLGQRGDVPAIQSRVDMICHAARAEGMPNAVLEAMAASKPIVATCVGGTPELIHDGAHGLLVPSRAPRELAAALLRLNGDRALADRMARAARKRIEERFTLAKLVERVDKLYTMLATPR
jgi:glycosyltransferase involved in cell wall biosynthesis